jgi:hypothetical protein
VSVLKIARAAWRSVLPPTAAPAPRLPPSLRVRPTTRDEAVARALLMAGPAGAAIRYRLADHSGGRDPFAPDPASHWRSAIKRIPLATCDCSGFVAWELGYDRHQPGDEAGEDWWNTDAIVRAARSATSTWFHQVLIDHPDPLRRQRPLPGDLVVYPSIDLDHDGSRDRVGHIGGIVGVAPIWAPGMWGALEVVHSSKGNDRRLGRAIAKTTGMPWAGAERFRGRTDPRWGAIIVRYQRFVAAPATS